MLVLSRRPNESVVIRKAGEVLAKVTLLRTAGDKCRIGFDADHTIEIVRSELIDRPPARPRMEPQAA